MTAGASTAGPRTDPVDDVLLVEHRSAVDWLTLNRPHKHNALNPELIDALCDYFEQVAGDPKVRVIVLRGNGPSFCAGLDLTAHRGGRDTRRILGLTPLIRACPQPVIALLHGAVKGGGFVIGLASDLRIASRSARMDDAFINLGLSGCDVGMSYFLPRMVGLSIASELMLTGHSIDAARAERLGLVTEIVDNDGLEAAATALASELLEKSPLGLRRTKEMLHRALAMDDLVAVIEEELDIQLEVARRDPRFKDRTARYDDSR